MTRLDGEVVDLVGLAASDVSGFIVSACPGRAVGSAKLTVCALRSLLRWLHLSGQTPTSLAGAVRSVAGWRLSSLPKGLEPDELRRLLGSCDRRTRTGRRDYAIMMLLSRLGLRAGEVAHLGLDDIDWRRGEVTIRGKGNRAERLSLPADVGTAVAAYLRLRPATAQGRSVFVRVHAPHRELTTGGITQVLFDAAQRAELPKFRPARVRRPPPRGVPRSTRATELHARGWVKYHDRAAEWMAGRWRRRLSATVGGSARIRARIGGIVEYVCPCIGTTPKMVEAVISAGAKSSRTSRPAVVGVGRTNPAQPRPPGRPARGRPR
jgi:integrase